MGAFKIQSNIDNINLHHLCQPEFPHTLLHVGSSLGDVPPWKSEHLATTAKSDYDLQSYCCNDVAITRRCLDPLVEQVRLKGLLDLYWIDSRMQEITRDLHRVGMYVVEDERKRLDDELLVKKAVARKQCVELGGIAPADLESATEIVEDEETGEELNPGSFPQICDLLFDKWKLPVTAYTDAGEPSTKEEALIALMPLLPVADSRRQFLMALRRYRKFQQARSTYTKRYVPNQKGSKSGLFVWPDGRIRASYNMHSVPGGRFACSKPNLQNVSRRFRAMYAAAPGHMLVYADQNALELRVAAGLANDVPFIQEFLSGRKVHLQTCRIVYGAGFDAKSKAERDRLYDFVKRITYAWIYSALVKTIHEQVLSSEDENFELPYLNVKLQQTRETVDALNAAHPSITRWWDKEIETWRTQRYLTSEFLKRRMDFADGKEDRPLQVNFRCQSSGRDVMIKAHLQLRDALPPFYAGPGTGLIQDGHDAVLVECPEDDVARVKGIVAECMNQKFDGFPLPFVGEAKSGRTWADVSG